MPLLAGSDLTRRYYRLIPAGDGTVGPLTLRFKKKADAGTVFTCVRHDGTSTSSDIGPHRGFGPMHDLCHLVVERWFGLREGFLGLLASGWSIEDFEEPGTAGRLPFEAGQAEWIAGTLSLDYAANQQFDPDAYYAAYDGTFRKSWPAVDPIAVTEDDLDNIRSELRALLYSWSQLPINETMDVVFDPSLGARRDLMRSDAP